MQFPRIHLNGTHGPDLLKDYTLAQNAVWAAIKAVQAAQPHGRDYYPINGDAISAATQEHVERLKILHDVHRQLEAICFRIHDQLDDQAVQRDQRRFVGARDAGIEPEMHRKDGD